MKQKYEYYVDGVTKVIKIIGWSNTALMSGPTVIVSTDEKETIEIPITSILYRKKVS